MDVSRTHLIYSSSLPYQSPVKVSTGRIESHDGLSKAMRDHLYPIIEPSSTFLRYQRNEKEMVWMEEAVVTTAMIHERG